MLNLAGKGIHQTDEGWLPVFTDETQTLGVMSIGFLLNKDTEAVVWRGPKKNAMIKQFLTDVCWRDRDVLVIDTPPGTSDEHITVMENLKSVKVDGAILVTTPQAVAVGDVRREVTFCKKAKLKILGIIENMSGFECPNCKDCTNIFSKGGGRVLADHVNVPFLAEIPIDPNLAMAAEKGQNFISEFRTSSTANAFATVIEKLQK